MNAFKISLDELLFHFKEINIPNKCDMRKGGGEGECIATKIHRSYKASKVSMDTFFPSDNQSLKGSIDLFNKVTNIKIIDWKTKQHVSAYIAHKVGINQRDKSE